MNRFGSIFVYRKVLFVFLLLIIPVYVLNFWLSAMGVSFIKQQYSDSNTYNLSFYTNQLNDELYFLRNLQLQLMIDSDLQKLSFMASELDTYERLRLVTSVIERISVIRNSSEYVENIGVYVKTLNQTLSTKQGLRNMPNEEWELIESLVASGKKQSLYMINGRLFFIEYSNQRSTVSYLELSIHKLKETLRHLVPYESSGVMLINEQLEAMIALQLDEHILTLIEEQYKDQISAEKTNSFIAKYQGSSYQIAYEQVPSLGWKIITYVNEDEITDVLHKYNRWMIVLWIVSVIVIILFALSVNRMIHRPLHRLIRMFKVMEVDQVKPFHVKNEVSEFDYLYHGLHHMMDRLNLSIRENYEHKLALQNSELKQLQSQINPHFLYNSFYNIYRIIKIGDYDNVAKLTQKLASYYQFITRSGTDEVPLAKEYRHALDYCEIQNIRFANRMTLEIAELPDRYTTVMIPRIILQPIIENAFEHSFEHSSKQGVIRITILSDKQLLELRIEDNGDHLTDLKLQELIERLNNPSLAIEKTGLINVDLRLKMKYGDRYGLILSRSNLGGMSVIIAIPLTGGNEE